MTLVGDSVEHVTVPMLDIGMICCVTHVKMCGHVIHLLMYVAEICEIAEEVGVCDHYVREKLPVESSDDDV